MNLVEKIKSLFTRKRIKEEPQIKDHKTLENISLYDDVIIVIDNIFYNGWISGVFKNRLIVCYDTPETKYVETVIPITRPYTRSIIKYNNKTLYLNKYEYKE